MSSPFISEIRMFGFNFAPKNWAMCNGQTLSIQQNAALFSLLGTTYGGNGVNTFALPDLRGRAPLHFGTSPYSGETFTQGQVGGEENHTLTVSEVPPHSHQLMGSLSPNPADSSLPSPNFFGQEAEETIYGPATSLTAISPATIPTFGQSQPHNNMQPYLVLTFCICLFGIFPSRN